MQTARTIGLARSRRILTLTAVAAVSAASARCAPYIQVGSPANGTLAGAAAPRTTSRGSAADVSSSGRATADVLRSESNGTYIGSILAERDSTLQRWPDRRADPIHVHLDGSLDGRQIPVAFENAVQSAFTEWSSIGLPIRFVYVQRAADADVQVHFADYLQQKTGSTTWRANHAGWLLSGDITLAMHIGGGQPIDAHGMRQIALHEVGHLVGLSHSPNTHDIMAPLVRANDLTAEDVATARLLYSFQPGRID